MKVLVIGGGGREHALVWALRKSARVTEVVCAPGNGGIAAQARCVPVDGADLAALIAVVEKERPELTVVGPEVPLSLGIVDELQRRGFRVFGPTQAAARLESSKAFAKEFMQRHGIPTAAHAVCTSLEQVREELKRFGPAVVVKADGLAAGKGVVICESHAQAVEAAEEMFSGALLGAVQGELVLEEFLEGEELSFFALCDGKHAVAMAAAQDHKRVGEGDTGPNTGGMGAYSTDALMTPAMRKWLTKKVAQKVVDGMRAEGVPFAGILFCGMMMSPAGPMVLEFNTRFGDPETQAMMMRMETDVLDLFDAAVDGTAETLSVILGEGASVCVIAASGGYPGKYPSGKVITGLEAAGSSADGFVFHSGTALKDGELVTAGGRVLGVTAMSAEGLEAALTKAYAMLAKISFEGMQYRRDIGWRALGKASLEIVKE
ncbi:phosphoribosylamine--glycine ligase [Granulicella sp. dw_53]|uniref:phosphoribosylamine--glycine ligase n=1 Tax=Granulicella sp. dw_53 TaxID=2719792 RepID=UPI001BD368A4|nr:phosphoribosylamine--glycine ligase [Granulicella sp. dw_53]